MEKQIHVNSYVKKDGTQVKEHYRNVGYLSTFAPEENRKPGPWDIVEFPEEERGPVMSFNGGYGVDASLDVPVIEGSVEVLDLRLGGDGVLGTVLSVAMGLASTAATTALQMYQASQAAQPALLEALKPKLDTAIGNLKTTQVQFEKLSQKYLDKLTTTKDKKEYANLLKSYTQQKALNQQMKDSLARIQYASDYDNYQAVVDELQNYQSNFDEVMKQTVNEKPLNIDIPKIINSSNPIPIPYMNNYIPDSNINSNLTKAYLNKGIIDRGVGIRNINHDVNDAAELWKASSHDFSQSKGYIEKNGKLVRSLSELPSQELQQIVTEKLQQQLGTPDALGVIFQPDSSLSQAISNSMEMKEYFQKNAAKLLSGQPVEKGSTNFASSSNLHNALGHADILYSYIDQSGNLNSIVFDTYDFNPNDPNPLVQMARSVQEANLLRNYYTLTIVIIPKEQWLMWL